METRERLPVWTAGIATTLRRHNACISDPNGWLSIDDDGKYIFITEADHEDREASIINLRDGIIQRRIEPLNGDAPRNRKRHSCEVLKAVILSHKRNAPVRVLLTKYTKYSKTPKRDIKAMLVPWEFQVAEVEGGSVEEGFSYRLERIATPQQ